MIQERHRRRNADAERQERLRYEVLERLYLLSGTGLGEAALDEHAGDQIGLSLEGCGSVVADLERLGYLARSDRNGPFHLTETGIAYLQKGAWRRRSVRG